jgi:hypothetical protein
LQVPDKAIADLISDYCCGADKEEVQGIVQVSRRVFECCEEEYQDEYLDVAWPGGEEEDVA